MKDGKLEKSDINPIVSDMSYTAIVETFGKDAAHVAKLMGVKKEKSSKKENKY
jgi:hypothetical protein